MVVILFESRNGGDYEVEKIRRVVRMRSELVGLFLMRVPMRYGDRCNVMFILLRLCSKHEICEWWLVQRVRFRDSRLDLLLEPGVELRGMFQKVQMNEDIGVQGFVRLAVLNHRDLTEIRIRGFSSLGRK